MALIKEQRLSPIVKWAGGKEQELKYIHPCLPKSIHNYYEPFVGGGAVYFSLQADAMFINDKSHELISLYQAIACQDAAFFEASNHMVRNWLLLEKLVQTNATLFIETYTRYARHILSDADIPKWVAAFVLQHHDTWYGMFDSSYAATIEHFLHELRKNITNKLRRMKKIAQEKCKLPHTDIVDNVESAIKSAFYMYIRYLYNNIASCGLDDSVAVALFFFIRNYAYSGMFRYNSSGGFNVPYGGIGYNRKNLAKKLAYLQTASLQQHLQRTTITNLDFEAFFEAHTPQKGDFVFLDPPYDSEFSTYAQNTFTKHDQVRLALYLQKECAAHWMLVIKNTDFIYELYDTSGIYKQSFDKKYLVSFQNRNDKDAEHLLITNYDTQL